MQRYLWSTALASVLSSACQPPTVTMEKRDSQVLSRAIVIERSESSGADANPQVDNIYQKFPAKFVVFPENRPVPGNPYYFGVAAGSEQPYQIVAPYYIAAVPDFDNRIGAPVFQNRYDEEQFLIKWSEEFVQDTVKVKRLDELAKSFRWQIDSNFVRDEEVVIQPELLANIQPYYKKTQRVLARRFTFLAPGHTQLMPRLDGTEDTIPLVIQEYTLAQIEAGKARYFDPTTGCAKCHAKGALPNLEDAYTRHSSDYLANYSDAQLIEFFKNATFPSGEVFEAVDHVHAFATPEDEQAMVAYLRNQKPSYDKIVELLLDKK